MTLYFDLRTTLAAGMVLQAVAFVAFLGMGRSLGSRFPSLRYMTIAYGLSIAAHGLFVLRGFIPPGLSIVVGNVTLLVSLVVEFKAILIFARRPLRIAPFLFLILAFGIFDWYFGVYAPWAEPRILASSLILTGFKIIECAILLRAIDEGRCSKRLGIIAIPEILIAGVLAVRFVLTLLLGFKDEWLQFPVWDASFILLIDALLVFVAFTFREGADRLLLDELEKAAEDKAMLFRETHHRTKNELALVSSLISLQGGNLKDRDDEACLRDLNGRIRAIAILHEKLYRNEDADAAAYIGSIAEGIYNNLLKGTGVRIIQDIRQVPVPDKDLIPLGLILNELVTNAAKHAFPGSDAGSITVRLGSDGNGYRLDVEDDGVGIPADAIEGDSLGLSLVNALADQLEAVLKVSPATATTRRRGTKVSLSVGGLQASEEEPRPKE